MIKARQVEGTEANKKAERNKMKNIGESKNFTFVELLILIAIIVILAALLLPALQGGLRSARISACASQQAQLYIGMIGYSELSNGYILKPDLGRSNGTWTDFWYSVCNDRPNGDPAAIQRHGGWMMAGVSTDNLFCPALTYEKAVTNKTLAETKSAWQTQSAVDYFLSGGKTSSAYRTTYVPTSYTVNPKLHTNSFKNSGSYPQSEILNCTRISKLKSYYPILADARAVINGFTQLIHHNGAGFNIMTGGGAIQFMSTQVIITASQHTDATTRNNGYANWQGVTQLPNTPDNILDLHYSAPHNNPFDNVLSNGAFFWSGVMAKLKFSQ